VVEGGNPVRRTTSVIDGSPQSLTAHTIAATFNVTEEDELVPVMLLDPPRFVTCTAPR
jgi:hypothetical protein